MSNYKNPQRYKNGDSAFLKNIFFIWWKLDVEVLTTTIYILGGKGTLTSNAWRSTRDTSSGNTYQWDYHVSAVYSGNKTVESIKTSWYGGSSLRNSGSISLGVSNSGATVGASSSWQHITTPVKYWENVNGAKRSDYRSNLVVSPSRDYRPSTISLTNTARVKLKGDPKPYEVSAGV